MSKQLKCLSVVEERRSMENLEPRRVKRKVVGQIKNPRAKRSRTSTHKPLGRAQKARKPGPVGITPPVDDSAENVSVSTKPSPDGTTSQVDEDAEDFGALYHETPATKRFHSHSSLTATEKFYALDMELRITAEVRGVTRKKIPWKAFRSIYLCGFSTEARPKLTVKSMQKIGIGDWEETEFWNRLRNVLSTQVRCIWCSLNPLLSCRTGSL